MYSFASMCASSFLYFTPFAAGMASGLWRRGGLFLLLFYGREGLFGSIGKNINFFAGFIEKDSAFPYNSLILFESETRLGKFLFYSYLYQGCVSKSIATYASI